MPELEFELPVSEQEFEDSVKGSWITYDEKAPVGTLITRDVEIGVVDWDNVGVSLKFPVTIVDGIDKGKQAKISAGISKEAVFKINNFYAAVGKKPEIGANGRPKVKPSDFEGEQVVGVWKIYDGAKTDSGTYPKLEDLKPKGFTVSSLV